MKIPFDIKFRPQIESGEYKVETRDGRPVRIICWDKKEYEGQQEPQTPIVYLLLSKGGCEHIMGCTLNGLYSDGLERGSDLFIITPEPEFTDWETFISGCLQKHGLLDCGAADRIAKECSAELLDLARKEIEEELKEKVLNDYWKQVADDCERARKESKEEVLMRLPRWEKCSGYVMSNYGPGPCLIFSGNGKHLMIDGYQIKLNELFKLPGFKED